MSQIENGLYSFLKNPLIYNLFQYLIGGSRSRKRCIDEFVRIQPGMRILDIGCGPGTALNYLPPNVEYYGIDINQDYIDQAKKKFGRRGVFLCNDLNEPLFFSDLPKFDLVLGLGILHHLNDAEVLNLCRVVSEFMHSQSLFITLDGCYIENQSRIARFLLRHDRGKNVRKAEEYESLAREVFSNVKISLLNDMLRVPYTIAIMECSGAKQFK